MIVRELQALFGFQIEPGTAERVERRIVDVDRRMHRLQGTQAAVTRGAAGMWGALAGLAAAAMFGRGFFRANADMETLRAGLVLTTGSAEAAAEAMEFVREFAAGSPDEVNQITMAYQRLVANGLDPTLERMTALGDAGAAVGIDVGELTDAMSAATIGNLERMDVAFGRFGYNFVSRNGVVFAQLGDQVTEIGSSFEDVSAFVEELGRTRFAGGMARQAATLTGRVSMLKDAVTAFFIEVGNNGARGALTDFIDGLTAAVGGSNSLARTIGGALATALRRGGAALRWIAANAETVRTIILLLGDSGVAMAIGRLIVGIRSVGVASLIAQAQMIAIPLAIGAAILGVVLLIDDLYAYLQGRPSLIGAWMKQNEGGDGPMAGIAQTIRSMIDEQGPRLLEIFATVKTALDDLRQTAVNLWEAFAPLRAWLAENAPGVIADAFARSVENARNFAAALGDIANNLRVISDIMAGGPISQLMELRAGGTTSWLRGMLPQTRLIRAARDAGDRAAARARGETDAGGGWIMRADPVGDATRAMSSDWRAPRAANNSTAVAVTGDIIVQAPTGTNPAAFGAGIAQSLTPSIDRGVAAAQRRMQGKFQ